jgi:hypothetical protein
MQKTFRLNKKTISQAILGLTTLLAFSSCDFGASSEEELISNLSSNTLITQAAINATDTIYLESKGALNSLNEGWNQLLIRTSKQIENTQFYPQMTMQVETMTHVHSAPFFSTKTTEGLAVDILITMPGEWSFFVVQNTDTLEMKVNVVTSTPSTVYKSVDPRMESRKIMIAMDFPIKPQVGSQDIQFQAYYYNTEMMPMKDTNRVMDSAMDTSMAMQHKMDRVMPTETWEELAAQFIPATDLVFEMTPSMPAMGHGSPNNESPVWAEDTQNQGLYAGKVNFSMTGDWQLDLKIEDNQGTLIDSVAIFELLVK